MYLCSLCIRTGLKKIKNRVLVFNSRFPSESFPFGLGCSHPHFLTDRNGSFGGLGENSMFLRVLLVFLCLPRYVPNEIVSPDASAADLSSIHLNCARSRSAVGDFFTPPPVSPVLALVQAFPKSPSPPPLFTFQIDNCILFPLKASFQSLVLPFWVVSSISGTNDIRPRSHEGKEC